MDSTSVPAYVAGMDCTMTRGWLAWMLSIAACGPSTDSGADASDTSGGADDGAPAEGSTSGSPATTGAGSSDGDDDDDTPTDDTTAAPTSGDTGDATGGEDSGSSGGTTGGPGMAVLCPDAQLELGITGTGQRRHDGRRVWASAVEPQSDPATAMPVVILEDMVTDGAFELSCPSGLTENFGYPSLAVVIDADDDGTCSDGDLAWTMQLFGWSSAQTYAFEGSEVFDTAADPPWLVTSEAWQPVAEIQPPWGTPLCAYYFPGG